MRVNRLVRDDSGPVHLQRVGVLVVGDQLRQGLEAVAGSEVGLGFDLDLVVILKFNIILIN